MICEDTPIYGWVYEWLGWWVGSSQITKNGINLDLSEIIQFCLKIYDLWRHPQLWVGIWVCWWMGHSFDSLRFDFLLKPPQPVTGLFSFLWAAWKLAVLLHGWPLYIDHHNSLNWLLRSLMGPHDTFGGHFVGFYWHFLVGWLWGHLLLAENEWGLTPKQQTQLLTRWIPRVTSM